MSSSRRKAGSPYVLLQILSESQTMPPGHCFKVPLGSYTQAVAGLGVHRRKWKEPGGVPVPVGGAISLEAHGETGQESLVSPENHMA